MIENYEKYLNMIQGKINGFFEAQKPYIACKKGCSLCCERGEYPFSSIEYQYLMKGFFELDNNLQLKIKEKIKEIKLQKEEFKGDGAFMHDCPFLINKTCTVYKYRGIICRTFGLLAQREGKTPSMPFCANLGLNYSSVYDDERKTISLKKFRETGFTIEPKIYNVNYNFLTNDTFAKGFGFDFGEKKPLIDWL